MDTKTEVGIEGNLLVVKVSIDLDAPNIKQTLVTLGWKHVAMLADLGWTPPPRAVLPDKVVRVLREEGLDTVAKVLRARRRELTYIPGFGQVRIAVVQRWLDDRPMDSDLKFGDE